MFYERPWFFVLLIGLLIFGAIVCQDNVPLVILIAFTGIFLCEELYARSRRRTPFQQHHGLFTEGYLTIRDTWRCRWRFPSTRRKFKPIEAIALTITILVVGLVYSWRITLAISFPVGLLLFLGLVSWCDNLTKEEAMGELQAVVDALGEMKGEV